MSARRAAAGGEVFMISVAAERAGMHPQTLRIYEARGLIQPQRSAGNTRLYSQQDIYILRRIQQLTTELGLNLAGVERVLNLEIQLQEAQLRLQHQRADMRKVLRAKDQEIARLGRVHG
jgi:MerR family transcriptional regulator/heat shock protein HspR